MAASVWGKEEKAGAAEVNLNKSELCKSAQGTRVIRCWCRRAGWLYLGIASGVQLAIQLAQVAIISPLEALLSKFIFSYILLSIILCLFNDAVTCQSFNMTSNAMMISD